MVHVTFPKQELEPEDEATEDDKPPELLSDFEDEVQALRRPARPGMRQVTQQGMPHKSSSKQSEHLNQKKTLRKNI
ncbi:hypothetical protein HDU81_000703 [Chytriomyces hyalinus]|nr:hypothetical protein HDU81_000703 [Chytriomyces hyalinus]